MHLNQSSHNLPQQLTLICSCLSCRRNETPSSICHRHRKVSHMAYTQCVNRERTMRNICIFIRGFGKYLFIYLFIFRHLRYNWAQSMLNVNQRMANTLDSGQDMPNFPLGKQADSVALHGNTNLILFLWVCLCGKLFCSKNVKICLFCFKFSFFYNYFSLAFALNSFLFICTY